MGLKLGAAGPVFYLAFETNAVEPPLIRPHMQKPETGSGDSSLRGGVVEWFKAPV